MGNHVWETFWATIWRTNHSVWFIGWVLPYFFERPVKNPSVWKESLSWIVPWIRSVRGENLEGRCTGCRTWGVGNDGRIGNLLEKTQRERNSISKRKWKIHFPAADGRIKLLGGDQDLRTPTLIRHRSIRGESHVDLLGESEGSPPPPPQDSLPGAGEAINDFRSMSGNIIYRHHVEPRVKLYSPRRIIPFSTEMHWRLQNYSYEFGCQARTPHQWSLEYWWVKRFVWFLDRFHSIYFIGRNTSRRIYVVRGEIDEKTADIQTRPSMARTLGENG